MKRIRLLRTVHLGLEEIRSLSEKESELTDVLLIHLRTLKKEQKDLEQSKSDLRADVPKIGQLMKVLMRSIILIF